MTLNQLSEMQMRRLPVKDSEMNCCDYDTITLYPSGTFNVQHKTSLAGKVKEIARISYGLQVTDSFKDGAYYRPKRKSIRHAIYLFEPGLPILLVMFEIEILLQPNCLSETNSRYGWQAIRKA